MSDLAKNTRKTACIVRGGKSDYTVVIAGRASAAEQNAARELTKYLEEMTGARLSVVTDEAKVPGKILSVGRNRFALSAGVDPKGLNIDGFVIHVDERDNVYIAGEEGRGTLYGVYELLRGAGCRFLTADFEVVPKRRSVRATETLSVPAFEMRTVFCRKSLISADYNAKLRLYAMKGITGDEAERVGGVRSTVWLGDFHSLCEYVPPQKYYDAHPEWFTGRERAQPCLSSGLCDDGTLTEGESYVRTLVENIAEEVRRDREHKLRYVTVGQMDNYNYCRCDRCLRQIERLGGTRAGQLVLLANTVAREVKKRLREMGDPRDELEFVTTSYAYSELPPVSLDEDGDRAASVPAVVPASDVIVWYAPADACCMHGLLSGECGHNEHERGLYLRWWRKITDRLFVWNYHTDYAEWLAWFPDMRALGSNYRDYKRMGVRGVLAETETSSCGFYKAVLTPYLASSLMWDPSRNVWSLVAEFNRYYFGREAGAIVTKLVRFIEEHFLSLARGYGHYRRHLALVTNGSKWISSAAAYSREFTDEAISRLAEADRAAEECGADEHTAEAYRRHLDELRAQVLYFKFRRYDESGYPQEEKRAFTEEYILLLKRCGVEKLGEGWGMSIGKEVDDLYAFAFPAEKK